MGVPLSRGEKAYQVTAHAIVICVALCCLIPCLFVVTVSVTPIAQLAAQGGSYSLFPTRITFVAYAQVFAANAIIQAFFISVARVVVGTSLHLAVSSAAGYALSKRQIPGYRILLTLVLLNFLFPPGLIPYYVVARAVHLVNSFLMYVVPSAATVWAILVFRQFFMELPPELEEAARLDGAGDVAILLWIVLPLSGPVYAALALFNAVWQWNDFLTAAIFVPDATLQPLANVLQRVLTAQIQEVSQGLNGSSGLPPDAWQLVPTTAEKMAVVVIATVPIVVVYPFLQKYFVKGVLTGAIKG